jgi:hypothetical protein
LGREVKWKVEYDRKHKVKGEGIRVGREELGNESAKR